MKKGLIIGAASIVILTVTAVVVYAGYAFGPNNIFYMNAKAGVNLGGLWVEGTMSDLKSEGIFYSKRVYARSGASGSYSAWKTPKSSPITVTHRDYGAFDDDYAEVRGEWK